MNFVRKLVNSNIFSGIIDIPKSMRNRKVEVIIKPVDDEPDKNNNIAKIIKLRGALSKYKKLDLIDEENNAWSLAVVEKKDEDNRR